MKGFVIWQNPKNKDTDELRTTKRLRMPQKTTVEDDRINSFTAEGKKNLLGSTPLCRWTMA